MVIAALALVGALIAVYTLMYSMGFLGKLACGTGGCETVQLWAKDQGLPVPLVGALGYTALMITAMLGLQPAFTGNRLIPLVLITAALIAAGFTLYLTYLEMYVINAWCRWCIASAVIVIGIVAATLPELTRLRQDTA
jgi:uncharacterized membrane protein